MKKQVSRLMATILERESKYPMLEMCEQCELECKKHGARNLTFSCHEFVGEGRLRGKKIQVDMKREVDNEQVVLVMPSQRGWKKPWDEDA